MIKVSVGGENMNLVVGMVGGGGVILTLRGFFIILRSEHVALLQYSVASTRRWYRLIQLHEKGEGESMHFGEYQPLTLLDKLHYLNSSLY